jgi:hypothetical protein
MITQRVKYYGFLIKVITRVRSANDERPTSEWFFRRELSLVGSRRCLGGSISQAEALTRKTHLKTLKKMKICAGGFASTTRTVANFKARAKLTSVAEVRYGVGGAGHKCERERQGDGRSDRHTVG